MNVERCDRYDIDELVEVMRAYSAQSPLPHLRTEHNEPHVRKVLTAVLVGLGAAWIARRDRETCGAIIVCRANNMWNPGIVFAHELAWWVYPQHRGTSAAWRLLRAYRDWADRGVANGELQYYTLSKMSNSPPIDYSRWGFSQLEETWSSVCQQQ